MVMNKIKLLILSGLLLIYTGCGTVIDDSAEQDGGSKSDGIEGQTFQEDLAMLVPASGCRDVWDRLQHRAVSSMEEKLQSNLELMLNNLEGDCMYPGGEEWDEGMDYDGSNAPTGDADHDAEKADDYSTTNNQVSGVDEADFVKNDGSYIYMVSNGRFFIIDAWPADEAQKISSTEIEGEAKKLFVHKDRAVVYSSLDHLNTHDPGFDSGYGYNSGECTYGYDCDFTGDGRALKITVMDISDRASPVLLRETVFQGSYLNSRRIDDAVYTAIVFPEVETPGIEYWPGQLVDYSWRCGDDIPYNRYEILAMFESLRAKNERIIRSASRKGLVPGISDIRYIDGKPVRDSSMLDECPDYYISGAGDGMNLVSLAAFEIDELDYYNITTIAGRPGAVYASRDSLYISVRHYRYQMNSWYFDDDGTQEEATTIHRFRLDSSLPGSVYAGSGVVKGLALNQFSMDEYENHLRIATTTGHVPDPDCHSTLSVLKAGNLKLKLVGQIDNIAPSEDIRSARFDDDVGFIVTFKKTDPLFVFDLSDPAGPVIKGKLKIPGYSTYMHLMDDAHLLTIGYDADDQDSFAWFTGIQLQIMDVSDLEDPRLVHKEVIGTRGTTSDAATNHLAFNYYGTRDLLALPIVICEGDYYGGNYGDIMTFSGLIVYETTAETGFSRIGGIPHEAPETEDTYRSACSNWWTQSNSKVKRSIFMEDFVYSIAMDKINVAFLDDLANSLVTIDLEN